MDKAIKGKVLDFISSIVFIVAFLISMYLFNLQKLTISHISVSDILLIIIGTYRVTRMVVYEKIFSLFRLPFKKRAGAGLHSSINNLLTCPWCASVWVSLFVFDIYYLVPYGRFFVYLMAISAIAAPLVFLGNMATLRNDILKKKRDRLENGG